MSDNEYEKKAKELGVPLIPPIKPPSRKNDNDVVGVCGECGREVCRVEMYSCPIANCPVQPKAVM